MADTNKKRVLIVDDDELILNALEALVKLSGFDVITAMDGYTAIQKIDYSKPDAVILDLILPGPNGVAVLKYMGTGLALATPVIVITAHGADHPVVKMAREAPNIVGFFQKPIRREALTACLKKALNIQ